MNGELLQTKRFLLIDRRDSVRRTVCSCSECWGMIGPRTTTVQWANGPVEMILPWRFKLISMKKSKRVFSPWTGVDKEQVKRPHPFGKLRTGLTFPVTIERDFIIMLDYPTLINPVRQ